MKHAEDVTFSAAMLERAANRRGSAEIIADMMRDDTARMLPFWRGKPLLAGDGLGLLPATHPVFDAAPEAPVFLGLDGDAPRFACDISNWQPEGLDEAGMREFVDRTEQHHPLLPDDHRFAELRAVMARLTPVDAGIAATAKAILGWHHSHGFCARCGAKSQIAMAGWQRNCPTCKTAHFPRTDPVVIMLITHGNDVLMGRSHGWPDGMYSLLAGFVEPGEPIEAAVRREVFEESGIEVGAVSYLASQPWPFPASLMIGCRGEAVTSDIQIGPEEIDDAIWVSREDIASAFAGTHPHILPSRKGSIAHFLLLNWLADRLD